MEQTAKKTVFEIKYIVIIFNIKETTMQGLTQKAKIKRVHLKLKKINVETSIRNWIRSQQFGHNNLITTI